MKRTLSRWLNNPGMLLFAPVMQLICGLMGFGMAVLIYYIEGEPAPLYMGTMMAMCVPVMCAMIYMVSYGQQFTLAVSMSATRKEFLLNHTLKTTAAFLLCYILTLLFWLAEQALYPALFDGNLALLSFGFLLDLRIVLPVIALCVLLSLFTGSLYARFGKKFWVVIYAVFMAVCIGLPRLAKQETLLIFFAGIPAAVWYGLGTAAAAAMLATILLLNRRQMVH